ncbi:unnamed protein product [Calypogeia fissa]
MAMHDDSKIDDMFRRFMSIGVSQSEGWMLDGSPVSSAVHRPAGFQSWTSADREESSSLLCGLDSITIPELSFRGDHFGRVLYGQFCIEPSMKWSKGWSVDDVATLLVDTNTNAIRVIMSKDLWDTAPIPERDYCCPLGKRVAIKEPLLEMCSDGVHAVRLMNPAQLICLAKVDEEAQSPAEMNGDVSMEELEKIRHEGNLLFAENEWTAAVSKYSECIDGTLCKLSSHPPAQTTSEDNFSRFLVFTYSNRAEARLRLLHYEDAFIDTEKALAIDPKHVKTLVRKGKAAHGPVEIRRVGYGHGRRGLFATRNVEPGELLLVSNPLAVFRQNLPEPLWNASCAERNLTSEVLKRITTSKRHMAQLHSLCGVGRKQEMEIPSMELFRPGSEWLPDGWEKFKADAEHVSAIVSLNATGKAEQSDLQDRYLASCEIILGIWALPSFANHSCSPNIFVLYIGDAMAFRASESILKGEELTMPYFGQPFLINDGVEARQAKTMAWLFTCRCARCLLEESLPKLSKINRALSHLKEVGDNEACSNFVRNVGESIAKLADEVEEVILSQCSKLGPKEHGWIRATFALAYSTKFLFTLSTSGDLRSRLSALILVLNSTAIWVGLEALAYAMLLLQMIEKLYPKHSRIYMLTFNRVETIRKLHLGDQQKHLLRKLRANRI